MKIALTLLLALSLGLSVAQEHSESHDQKTDNHGQKMDDHHGSAEGLGDDQADKTFTLRAELTDGGMIYIGEGGEIDGAQNPTLEVTQGEIVEITLINASPLEHDFAVPALETHSEHVAAEGDVTTFAFEASETGELEYYCSVPGHKEAGMLGTLAVDEGTVEPGETEAGSYQELSPEELASKLEQGGNFLLVNTHIPYAGAIPSTDAFIPFNEIEQYAAVLPKDKSAEIVVYCRSGGMSKSASASLVALGYENVKRLVGGMNAWQESGYTLQDADL